MAERYSIDGQILTDMADAIRNSRGQQPITTSLNNYLYTSATEVTIPISPALKANTNYKLTIAGTYATDGSFQRASITACLNDASGKVIITEDTYLYARTNTFYFKTEDKAVSGIYVTKDSKEYFTGYWTFEECDEDGNLTRFYTPQQMVDTVGALLPTSEDLIFTGENQSRFAGSNLDWLINTYNVSTKDIRNSTSMFKYSNLRKISFEINWVKNSSYTDYNADDFFNHCSYLEVPPKMNNFRPYRLPNMFSYCHRLREFPEGYFDNWDWSLLDNATSAFGGHLGSLFSYCYSLRKYPVEILGHGNPLWNSSTYSVYGSAFNCCYTLDELVNIPKPTNAGVAVSSNLFSSTFTGCSRLKELTFVDGITLNWKNQIIDLSTDVGCVSQYNLPGIIDYNSGITADKEVVDDATYQALKDDPDWFTRNVAYSRYNHTSAVNTINSLPTTGTGCIIKFKGAAGSATDGGAINTLTEEEIAVATAKGWTVSLV